MSDEAALRARGQPLRSLCGHLLRCVHQRHNAIWTEEVGGGLTGPQYAVLEAVRSRPGTDQRTVSAMASLDRSSTMEVIGRLRARGLVVSSRERHHSRRDAVLLTPAGDEVMTAAGRGVARTQQRLVARLPVSERPRVLESLRLIATGGAGPAPSQPSSFDPAPIQALPGHLVRRAQQRHTELFAEEVGRTTTGPQYAVLLTVRGNPHCSQRTVGDEAALDRSTTADITRRLVDRGWISRERDPADARRWQLRLTAAGDREVAALTGPVTAVQERLLAGLATRRRTQLIEALELMTGATRW